mmetsp:Transcript_101716/g.286804  ORF Transcript_101716/g.286804 Transcript_101716/m.286804 type:complete len:305 (-) Transcript_101716:35-949(-)
MSAANFLATNMASAPAWRRWTSSSACTSAMPHNALAASLGTAADMHRPSNDTSTGKSDRRIGASLRCLATAQRAPAASAADTCSKVASDVNNAFVSLEASRACTSGISPCSSDAAHRRRQRTGAPRVATCGCNVSTSAGTSSCTNGTSLRKAAAAQRRLAAAYGLMAPSARAASARKSNSSSPTAAASEPARCNSARPRNSSATSSAAALYDVTPSSELGVVGTNAARPAARRWHRSGAVARKAHQRQGVLDSAEATAALTPSMSRAGASTAARDAAASVEETARQHGWRRRRRRLGRTRAMDR